MVILIGGEKGGTGKTTLAVNLAAIRAAQGRDVLLVDTDIQGSASSWASLRDEAKLSPRIPCVQKFGKGLQAEIKDLAQRYQDIIIDAGGRDSVEMRGALVVSNTAYLPTQASQFDIWTLDRMDELVATAQGFNPDLKAYVVINRATPNPVVKEASEASDFIRDFKHLNLARAVVRDRIAFRRSVREGKGIRELSPADMKAIDEISTLYEEVFSEQPNEQPDIQAQA